MKAIGKDVKNKDLKIGDPVLLSFNTCGTCTACTDGHPAFCHTHALVNHNAVRVSDRGTPARRPNGQSVRSVSNLKKNISGGNTPITPLVIIYLSQVAERQALERY